MSKAFSIPKVLLYKLSKEDFSSSKSISSACRKLLQTKYSKEGYKLYESNFYLYDYLSSIRRKINQEDFLQKVNDTIPLLIESLKDKYPEEFPHEQCLGWYSEGVLATLYLQGKVTINLEVWELETNLLQAQKILDSIRDEHLSNCAANYEKWSTNRMPVVKGYIFKNMIVAQAAYSSIINFKKLTRVNVRWRIYLEPYIELEKVKTGWLVTEVKQPGGFISLVDL